MAHSRQGLMNREGSTQLLRYVSGLGRRVVRCARMADRSALPAMRKSRTSPVSISRKDAILCPDAGPIARLPHMAQYWKAPYQGVSGFMPITSRRALPPRACRA